MTTYRQLAYGAVIFAGITAMPENVYAESGLGDAILLPLRGPLYKMNEFSNYLSRKNPDNQKDKKQEKTQRQFPQDKSQLEQNLNRPLIINHRPINRSQKRFLFKRF
jgi:hypothetical protein